MRGLLGGKNKAKPSAEGFTALAQDSGAGREPAQPAYAANVAATDAFAPSLKEITRKRMLTDLLGGLASEERSAVLCVDALTVRVISSVMRLSEMLESNVMCVENITMKSERGEYLDRQPMPSLPVLYFITPTVESVNRMLHDYRDKKSPKYGKAHLYFTSHLPDALLLKIKASPLIKTVASFKELNLEMVCTESNAFTFDSPQSLPILFAPDESPASSEAKLQEQHRLAAMLTTLFATLGEMPHIRHSSREVRSEKSDVRSQK